MRLNKSLLCLLSAGTVILSGCGSIINGTTQDVGISSVPSAAEVTVDGQIIGKTPVTAQLRRKDNHIVKLELPGYLPYEATFTRSVSGWVWGNIIFGGLIGLAVDAISGGLYKLTPDQLNAELRSGSASIDTANESMMILVVMQPKADWEQVGQLAAAR